MHNKTAFSLILRVNLDSIQSETGSLLKQLNEAVKRVSISESEIKEQYAEILEVRGQTSP